MVEADPASVESRLVAGEIACPGCGGELRPWGHARWRTLRDHGRPVRMRPRRSRCRSCLVTHVLLPVLALLRRLDLAAVIVETLVGRHLEGRSRAEVVRSTGAPWDTGRGWLRRFERRAGEIEAEFAALACGWGADLGPIEPRAAAALGALEAMGLAALFRYSLIRELADPELGPRQRGARIRALAATDHAFDGQRVEVTGPTLRRWLRAWRAGGFQALVPAVRRQPNRTPAELLEAAEALKREAPKRTAVQVTRALAEAGRGTGSERTLQRHLVPLSLHG